MLHSIISGPALWLRMLSREGQIVSWGLTWLVFPTTCIPHAAIVVQLLSCVWLFATSWTAACQASLSFTVSQSLVRFIFTELALLSIPSHQFKWKVWGWSGFWCLVPSMMVAGQGLGTWACGHLQLRSPSSAGAGQWREELGWVPNECLLLGWFTHPGRDSLLLVRT